MTEEQIKRYTYTKSEVDDLIAAAVAEARAIDEASMRKHNRDATIISMILGFICLIIFLPNSFYASFSCIISPLDSSPASTPDTSNSESVT